MMLKPIGMIPTRWHVEQLAKFCEEPVTDIDLSDCQIIGASTMHEMIVRFPHAAFTGLEGFNETLYEVVLEAIHSPEWQRNQGGK